MTGAGVLRRRTGLLLGVTTAAAAVAAPAPAQDAPPAGPPAPAGIPFTVTPGVAERGYIRVRVTAEAGSTVQLFEQVRALRVPLATLKLDVPGGGRLRLAPWRCDRLDRIIVGVQTAPDGTVREASGPVTTPSCRNRLEAQVLNRPRAGGVARIAVRDRFGVGAVTARVCLGAGPDRTCRTAVLKGGQTSAVVTPEATSPGRTRLEVTSTGQRLVTVVDVRRKRGNLRVLAAGDSQIQVLDSFLRQRLKRFGASVISDDQISTSISNPGFFDWPARARATSATIRPDVTVMFLGANDGFPLRTAVGSSVGCCSVQWSRELARRARGMMRSYSRGGKGRVYWMLLPPPRKASFARVFEAVNRAYLEAAEAYPDTVRIVDLRRTFPDPATGRQADGVHLSTGSARIAAGVIERQMRRDGLL